MRNSKHVRNMVISAVKPILENWSKIKLIDNVGVYGFRRYLRGSVLRMHVDRLPTHILSAILQVRACLRLLETLGEANGALLRLIEIHGDSCRLMETHAGS